MRQKAAAPAHGRNQIQKFDDIQRILKGKTTSDGLQPKSDGLHPSSDMATAFIPEGPLM